MTSVANTNADVRTLYVCEEDVESEGNLEEWFLMKVLGGGLVAML